MEFKEIQPINSELGENNFWKPIDKFSLCASQETISLCIREVSANAMIVSKNLQNLSEKVTILENFNEFVQSLTSNGTVLVAVVNIFLRGKGMSSSEYNALKQNNITEYLYFYQQKSMKLSEKIPWSGAGSALFHPNGKSIAIGGKDKSAFIYDYEKLLES